MIIVEKSALEKIEDYFKKIKKSPIRIYWSDDWGTGFQMTLDEPLENDFVWIEGDFKFIIEHSLMKQSGTITIDHSPGSGFSVSSSRSLVRVCSHAN